jgi:hypothetical protein
MRDDFVATSGERQEALEFVGISPTVTAKTSSAACRHTVDEVGIDEANEKGEMRSQSAESTSRWLMRPEPLN